jgi:hypothetical protein
MNDLATTNHNDTALALPPNTDLTGLSNIGKLKPSNIILVQNMTQDPKGAKPGQFLDQLTGEAYDELTLIPLRIVEQRVLFPPGEFGQSPICRSEDGLVPSPFAQFPQAKSCDTCPKSQWLNKQRPPCNMKFNMLVLSKETKVPHWLQIGGTGIRPTRDMIDTITRDVYIMQQTQGKTYRLYDYFFTIKSEQVKGKQGIFYVPRYTSVLKVQNPGEFSPFFEEFVKNIQKYHEQLAQAQAEAAVDNAVETTIAPQQPVTI